VLLTGEDLCVRAQLANGKEILIKMKTDAEESGTLISEPLPKASNFEVKYPLYCRQILDGFRSSAKLESIITDYMFNTPADEKTIMLSFFKSSLDLLEAIFHYELKINYARFDGDVSPEEREQELERFKREPECRVLLMTVQTGGTGLNIVEVCVMLHVKYNSVLSNFVFHTRKSLCLGEQVCICRSVVQSVCTRAGTRSLPPSWSEKGRYSSLPRRLWNNRYCDEIPQ